MPFVSTRVVGRIAALVLAGLCAGCVSATPGTTCQPEASSFAFGMNSKWLMVVGPAGCSDTLDLTGGMLLNSAIVQQAQNGTAFVQGASYGYTPRAGFTGRDQYVMSLTGQGNAGSATSLVTVQVNVK